MTVAVSETLTALAAATGYAPSSNSFAYTINLPPAAAPIFSVTAGAYTTPQTLTISDATTGATIYYTTNGTAPTTSSTKYIGPITVGVTEAIKAIGTPSSTAINFINSAVASAIYTINLPTVATPTFSVTASTYVTVQTVSLSDATTGATIYYATNGPAPTASSTVYNGSIIVGVSQTIEDIAVNTPNYKNSTVASAVYVITLPPPAFTITSSNPTVTIPAGGSGSVTLTITANAAFNGSTAFTCSGFLPVGATCAFSPSRTITTVAGTSGTTTLAVTAPAATAVLHHDPTPMFPGTMLAGWAMCPWP